MPVPRISWERLNFCYLPLPITYMGSIFQSPLAASASGDTGNTARAAFVDVGARSMMEKTIVVTGAYGFIGRHVARLFAQRGHKVVGIGHGEWPREEWESWGLSGWHQTDITLSTLQQYAGCPSAIVHCAGSGSVYFSVEYPLADFERTVVTTAHVLEYVRLRAPSCSVGQYAKDAG